MEAQNRDHPYLSRISYADLVRSCCLFSESAPFHWRSLRTGPQTNSRKDPPLLSTGQTTVTASMRKGTSITHQNDCRRMTGKPSFGSFSHLDYRRAPKCD